MRKLEKGASQRQLRVGELIRHALAELLSRGELREPAIEGVVITVPEVRMTPDLKLATAFVMPLGGEGADRIIEALDRNRRFLRGALARRVDLKYTPDLRFRVDKSFAEGERIDALLRNPRIARDLEERETASDASQ
jgi:ribosome-binding factor A